MAIGSVQNKSANAENISYDNTSTSSIITGDNVQEAIDQLFTSVSNGKSEIASAITDKGVNTSADASFAMMAENIGKISTNNIEKGSTYPSIQGFISVNYNLSFDPTYFLVYINEVTNLGNGSAIFATNCTRGNISTGVCYYTQYISTTCQLNKINCSFTLNRTRFAIGSTESFTFGFRSSYFWAVW